MLVSLPTLTFDFSVVSLDPMGREIKCEHSKVAGFTEALGNGITLEMVQIPGGTAQIGSPKAEERRLDSENELRSVNLPSFFMGRYPITQSQWRAVALLPKVTYPLDPDPSCFKGLNRPVEQVSWYDAVEFCARLSRATRRSYRLPTETEWEYACRAGTLTPFHFGETLTTDVANHCGENYNNKQQGQQGVFHSGTYAQEPIGSNRKETKEVGCFHVANGFGLYDMHGNIWEWCNVHPNKASLGTPKQGCWEDSVSEDLALRPLRGGSWKSPPAACRSSFFLSKTAGYREAVVGFRVFYSATEDHSTSEKPSHDLSQSVLSNTHVDGNVSIGEVTQNIIIYAHERASSDT